MPLFRKDESMAKSSRWSQWVISESADPGIPLPWTLVERVREKARDTVHSAISINNSSPQSQALR